MTTETKQQSAVDKFFAQKAFHPDRSLGSGNVTSFLVALLLGWLSFPMVYQSQGAVLFIAFIGFLILLLKLVGRNDALWIVLAIIVGIAIDLVFHTSSSALGGEVLLRSFFCLWLVVLI